MFRLALVTLLFVTSALQAQPEAFGVKTHDPVSAPPSTLFRIAANGSSVGIIAEVTLGGAGIDVDGLALGSHETLYGFQVASGWSRLIIIDPATAEASVVGLPLQSREIRGAACTSAGRLLALDVAYDCLLEIDPSNGEQVDATVALTLAGETFDVTDMVDLVEVDAETLVLARGNELYALDATSGVLTLRHVDDVVAPDGIALGIAGLAWLPDGASGARLVVYDVQWDDDLFAYDLVHDYQRSPVLLNLLPDYNAGRGDLASRPTDVVGVDNQAPTASLHVSAAPNPCNPRTTVSFTLAADAEVRVVIYDLAGRRVRELAHGRFDTGAHNLAWDGRGLPSGVYVCRVSADDAVVSALVTLVK